MATIPCEIHKLPWREGDLTFEEDVALDTLTVEHQAMMRQLAAELGPEPEPDPSST